MININEQKYKKIELWYLDFMLGKVIDKIDANPGKFLDLKNWFDTNYIDTSELYSKDLWKEILINPFDKNIQTKYKILEQYYSLCRLMQRDEKYIKLLFNYRANNGVSEDKNTFYMQQRENILKHYFFRTFIKNIVRFDINFYKQSFINYKLLFQELKNKLGELNNILKHFINYELLSNFENKRTELIVKLECTVCPYCNRQYISNYQKKNQSTLAHLDHFIPKEYFLLYSLSLYNFIPSCASCNTLLKLTSNMAIDSLISKDGNEELVFDFEFHDLSSTLGITNNLDIKIITNKFKMFILEEQFALESQYEFHKKDVQEFQKRLFLCNNLYFKSGFEKLFKIENKTDVKELILGNTSNLDDIYETTLSKMRYDLFKYNNRA